MKKAFLFGMMALILASSFTLFSCAGDSGGSNRAFIGTWVTSRFYTGSGGSYVPATVIFTGSDWTLTVPSANINEKGKYKLLTDDIAQLTQDGLSFGSARVSSTAMDFTCTSPGNLHGASGTFTKQQQ